MHHSAAGWRIFLSVWVLLSGPAFAQQLPTQPPIRLELSVEQTKLIVETLGAIGCQNVTQLVLCQHAVELLAEIRRQAKEQVK